MIVGLTFTAKQALHVEVPWSGLVTVTSRAPMVASDAIVTFTVKLLELLNVGVELTVIPVPENEIVAPLAK